MLFGRPQITPSGLQEKDNSFPCSERMLSSSNILLAILLLGEWPNFSYSAVF